MKKQTLSDQEIRDAVEYAEIAINWINYRNLLIEENKEQMKFSDRMIDIFKRKQILEKEQNQLLIESAQNYIKDIRNGRYGTAVKNIKLPKLIK
jgi:hypothetical protein